MENKKINKVFKQVFKTFMGEMVYSYQPFVDGIERCDTYADLAQLLENHGEEIAEHLGVEGCDYCDDKDEKIKGLERSVDNLEREIEDLEMKIEKLTPQTLDDEYKFDAFMKNKDSFSVSEFESLVD